MTLTYLGNRDLLHLPKTAFLASSTIPVEMVMRSYEWAIAMRKEGRCIISGFSSKLERDVWNFLVKGKQPIILVLARSLYLRVPPELQSLLDAGRLLIISTSASDRQSKATAQARNRYICELADQIVFVGATESSSLYPLKADYRDKLSSI